MTVNDNHCLIMSSKSVFSCEFYVCVLQQEFRNLEPDFVVVLMMLKGH